MANPRGSLNLGHRLIRARGESRYLTPLALLLQWTILLKSLTRIVKAPSPSKEFIEIHRTSQSLRLANQGERDCPSR